METSAVNTQKNNMLKKSEHYIVAIGASAGGLEAIHDFFDNVPESTQLSFIIIQHLSPDYKSLLVELISKHTHMQVFEAQNNMPVQKKCVYVIPNNKLMTIRNGKLVLAEKSVGKGPNTAIDTFLYTLAEERKGKAIAAILSGTGTDGTRGIAAIKECGGMVIVQDPLTAKFDGMPHSAINSGHADFILPPEMMPEEIYNFIQENPARVLNKGKVDDNLLEKILEHVLNHTGYDFNNYKAPTITRRLSKRMLQADFDKLEDYLAHLDKHPEEARQLGKEFLIGVTKFFRDKPAFQLLDAYIIPAIVDSKQDGDVLKVWVTACSTGEEAYSIAISIDQYLQKKKRNLDVKIFATDINESSVHFASKNAYPLSISKDIEPTVLKKYFIQTAKSYSVVPRIRKQIVFAKHNIIKDPTFINNDLISCRNMLIYMDPVLQQKVQTKLHFSLNSSGYLFLGSSETASSIKDGLKEVDSKWKIYKKNGNVKINTTNLFGIDDSVKPRERTVPGIRKRGDTQRDILLDFSELICEDLGYVGFYIDHNYAIKETIGNYRKYLSLPEKQLALNLLKMVPKELSVAINTAVRKSSKDLKKVLLKSVRYKENDRDVFVNILVKPANIGIGAANTLIVIGENIQKEVSPEPAFTAYSAAEPNEYVLELEAELSETRTNLQMAVEGMETTNEELQSSNEELLSANEELQSSNEELQSLNEELHTLNTEHQIKIKELVELNDDLNNYFSSTNIGQIFLDSDLNIRKFNPAATSLINLIETDIGRPLNHISTNFKYDNLLSDVKYVKEHGQIIEQEVVLANGHNSLVRLYPYIRQDKQYDGVVITFVDISAITHLNNIIKGVFNSSLSAIMALKAIRNPENQIIDFECITANYASLQLTGPNVKSLRKNAPVLLKDGFLEKYSQVVKTGKPLQAEFHNKQEEKDEWYHVVAVKMLDGLVITFTNITDKKASDIKLKKNYNELIVARENLKSLNSQLEDTVNKRTKELSESEERFRLVAKATNDAIWDWNLVNNHIWWNESFYAQFGYEQVEASQSGVFWLEHIHPADRQRVESNVYEVINSGKKIWFEEYRFMKADGSYAYIFDRGYVLHDEFNTPYRMLGSKLDVTKLREAERKALASEGKFRRIFESNMIGMFFSNYKGEIISANDYVLNMLGFSRKDIEEGKLRWDNLTPPEYAKLNNKAIDQLKHEGLCPAFENEYYRKDGSRVPALVGSAAIEEDDAIDAVTYVIDLTEKKEAEAKEKELQSAVKKNEDKLRFLADAVPQKIWTALPDGNIDYFNKVMLDYTGKSLEEFRTKGWKDIVHPEDWERYITEWSKAIVSGHDFEIERRLLNAEGEYRWHLTRSIAQHDSAGNITIWIGSSTDIHEQKTLTEEIKSSEIYFRQLADKTPFMIWKVDENGQCNYVNIPWITFTGLSFENSMKLGWNKAFHPEDKEREYTKFMDCFHKRESYQSKFRLKRKDGEYRWVLGQSNPVINDYFEGYIGSLTDIHDQEMAQQTLKLLMQKKDEFMSIASHELKTPITSMKASLQFVERIADQNEEIKPVQPFLERATRQINKLSDLVNDLLNVTKIQAGKMLLNKTSFTIGQAIQDCADQIQITEDSHRIEIKGKTDTVIFADKHRIEQVIINFLSNAIKYSPQSDKVILTIKPGADHVRVEVKDFGIGIPEDKVNYVFDRFFRVQESSQKFSGLGLGLYISAEIIRRHGGEVGVVSKDGNGSEFWFTLPLN
ncbi:PAS domain S-box protein [Rubrolithibacter danxiaensis]|uniref:PAS domain S-box protein n=1 Tax=Rubrolithibacter danxiaensis TaxID=3390805 RepID=UPI003BF8F8C4